MAYLLHLTFQPSGDPRVEGWSFRVDNTGHRGWMGGDLPTVTVKEFFDSFVERKKPEVSASTYSYYKGNSKRFLTWLGDRAGQDIAGITGGEN